MRFEIDLFYDSLEPVRSIGLSAGPQAFTINRTFFNGKIMDIMSQKDWVGIATDMKTTEIIPGKLIFLFFTYEGKVFLSILNSIDGGSLSLHILIKVGEELEHVLGEYKGFYTTLDNLDSLRSITVNRYILDKILSGEEIKGTKQGRCVIRI
ncbi:MAG: hypothetical protein PHE25_05040 [Candidatus Gracilibacteria bacterium]|nr:hypothetical protein [Candidatus Gracilibacteria bacterium]